MPSAGGCWYLRDNLVPVMTSHHGPFNSHRKGSPGLPRLPSTGISSPRLAKAAGGAGAAPKERCPTCFPSCLAPGCTGVSFGVPTSPLLPCQAVAPLLTSRPQSQASKPHSLSALKNKLTSEHFFSENLGNVTGTSSQTRREGKGEQKSSTSCYLKSWW